MFQVPFSSYSDLAPLKSLRKVIARRELWTGQQKIARAFVNLQCAIMLTKWAECHRISAKWGPTPTPETSVGSGSSMLTADWKTKKDILFCWPLWTASRFWTHTTQAKARITTMICCLLRLQITTTRAPSWQLAELASVDLGLPKGHLGKHELKQALSSKAVHKHLEKMHFKSKLSAVLQVHMDLQLDLYGPLEVMQWKVLYGLWGMARQSDWHGWPHPIVGHQLFIFLRGRKGDISPVLGDHGGFIDAVLEFAWTITWSCCEALAWTQDLRPSPEFDFAFWCFLAVFCSVQNVVGLMWWSTVLILRCIFSHSLYHALWLFFEKGWTSFSTSPWCSIWFLLSAPCLSIVRHHCTARKLQSEDANAQVPDHADTEDADRHAQTCHNLSSPLQEESRYLRVYFNTEGILYDSMMILYIWFYDSVYLCLFWFTMKGRGKHSHAGRDLAIHPSRSFSAGAMCSHAFRMLRCVSSVQRCSLHELQTSANHHWAMDLEFHVGQLVGL